MCGTQGGLVNGGNRVRSRSNNEWREVSRSHSKPMVANIGERKGLTQDTLAEMVDCAPAYISQIENGKKNPGIAILSRIADVLDISMDLITGNRTERWITEPSRAERILCDCNNYEYEMIIGIMERTKQLLRQNAPLMNLDER